MKHVSSCTSLQLCMHSTASHLHACSIFLWSRIWGYLSVDYHMTFWNRWRSIKDSFFENNFFAQNTVYTCFLTRSWADSICEKTTWSSGTYGNDTQKFAFYTKHALIKTEILLYKLGSYTCVLRFVYLILFIDVAHALFKWRAKSIFFLNCWISLYHFRTITHSILKFCMPSFNVWLKALELGNNLLHLIPIYYILSRWFALQVHLI
jgi:hypothetical protein